MISFAEGEPTIRNAIIKRLDAETGVKTCEVRVDRVREAKAAGHFISVGVLVMLDGLLVGRSLFHLPDPCEHLHLLNEIDEMCEQFKSARRRYTSEVLAGSARHGKVWQSLGSGLRGRWPERAPAASASAILPVTGGAP